MSIAIAPSYQEHIYASSAWVEYERLRARRPALCARIEWRSVGMDRERERRRKKKEWQRWQDAMNVAEEILRHATLAKLTKLNELQPKEELIDLKLSKFSSRSPTLCSAPPPLATFLPLKTEGKFEFTFTTPTSLPSGPGEVMTLPTFPERSAARLGCKRRCIQTEDAAQAAESVHGQRLLSRLPSTKRSRVTRKRMHRKQKHES